MSIIVFVEDWNNQYKKASFEAVSYAKSCQERLKSRTVIKELRDKVIASRDETNVLQEHAALLQDHVSELEKKLAESKAQLMESNEQLGAASKSSVQLS